MLQGEAGFSRKRPDPRAASHYYSLPQLEVSGRVIVDGRVRGYIVNASGQRVTPIVTAICRVRR